MSNNYLSVITQAQQKFDVNCKLSFEKEKTFAIQQITKTDFATKIANNNPTSLKLAMANVANIGLSLNPAEKLAYLVPRDGAIHLDISYRGLVRMATDSGCIEWVKAELVRENDVFEYQGINQQPLHKFNPFKPDERGEIVGVYCVAKTTSGDYLIDTMDMDDIHKVKLSSKAFTSGKPCPWTTFEGEMIKKTIIKRASKQWPSSQKMQAFNEAIDIINQHEGLIDRDALLERIVKFAVENDKDPNELAKQAQQKELAKVQSSELARIAAYCDTADRVKPTIEYIKQCIEKGDDWGIYEALSEIDNESAEMAAIFKAPTKGGLLTVDERKYLSSDEYKAKIQEILDMQAEEELDKQQLRSQQ